jgi:hypothetical protein
VSGSVGIPAEPLAIPGDRVMTIPMDGQGYDTFVVEFLRDERRQVRRTRVVHVQTGVEERWAGWDAARLLRFVVTHGDLSPPEGR